MRMPWIVPVAVLLVASPLAGGIVPAAAADRTIGERIDDATITASVKTKLTTEHAKNLVNINVDTSNGVVHLQGVVPTEQDRSLAGQLAQSTDGVKQVVNDLKVASTGSSSPSASPATK